MKKILEKIKQFFLLSLSLFFVLGAVFGWFVYKYAFCDLRKAGTDFVEVRQGNGYNFINPLLECDGASENLKQLTLGTKNLQSDIEKYVKNDNLQETSVYFRDLNNGPWFGINYDNKFTPASLLKVPIMIAYLKLAESNPKILTKAINYENRIEVSDQNIKNKHIEFGKSYTVDELLRYMIKYSDNIATQLLLANLDSNFLSNVYQQLGVSIAVGSENDFMSIREYSSFFRVLYNASYLNQEMSEKALALLAESEYHDGLYSGVPNNIRIAHKFGERKNIDSNGTVYQLHDCGIVYYPKHPYLLCVMTRDVDSNKLPGVISGISKLIYEDIENSDAN